MLQGGQVTVSMGDVDAGIIGTTAENLEIAANEEQQEGVVAYTEAAKVARKEGFDDIADHFEAIASIEKTHEARFRKLLEQVKNGTVWKRDKAITWKCLVCGFEYVGTEPRRFAPHAITPTSTIKRSTCKTDSDYRLKYLRPGASSAICPMVGKLRASRYGGAAEDAVGL